MRKSFYVVNAKTIIITVIIVTITTMLSIAGNKIVDAVIETAASNRLIPIYSVDTLDKRVALTFDCAWGASDIEDIITTLENNNIYATFFVVGTWVKKYPEAIQIMSEAGMEIGNHSDTHTHVNKISYEENINDMEKCNSRIEEITGINVKFYRGPYGEYNNTVMQAAEDLGMQVIQWDIDTLDYTGKTPSEMCERIKNKIRSGSIILMHNDTEYTASRIATNNKYYNGNGI